MLTLVIGGAWLELEAVAAGDTIEIPDEATLRSAERHAHRRAQCGRRVVCAVMMCRDGRAIECWTCRRNQRGTV